MSSSRTQCRVGDSTGSLEELGQKSASPGSLNDDLLVRSVVTRSIKLSGKSRAHIADEMSELLALNVTERMITSFTAESKELHRWPGAWDRAFCHATGDNRLLYCRLQAAGLRVITQEEEKLLEIGRQYLRRKHAEKRISSLELDFDGVDL